MPYKQKSHSERQRAKAHPRPHDDYERRVRAVDPALRRAKQIRSSQRWRHVRLVQLAKFPLCANPYGLHATFEPAVEVDHIHMLRTHPHLAFEMSNLQSLCQVCHHRKSGGERGTWYRILQYVEGGQGSGKSEE